MRLSRWCFVTLLVASASRAEPNDVQLFRLGNVDEIKVCSKCDNTPNDVTARPGSPASQEGFARLASELGLAMIPHWLSPAESLGQAGFEYGISIDFAFVHGNGKTSAGNPYWVTEGNPTGGAGPTSLAMPTLHIRKGLPFSFEFGGDAAYIVNSSMVAMTVNGKWALSEGYASLPIPDFAVRGFGTRLVGAPGLDLTIVGIDLGASKAFSLGGIANLTPYVGITYLLLDAASGVIDFDPFHTQPSRANSTGPEESQSVFHPLKMSSTTFLRPEGGIRLIYGVLVAAVEISYATGTNAIADKDPKSVSTSLFSTGFKLGLDF